MRRHRHTLRQSSGSTIASTGKRPDIARQRHDEPNDAAALKPRPRCAPAESLEGFKGPIAEFVDQAEPSFHGEPVGKVRIVCAGVREEPLKRVVGKPKPQDRRQAMVCCIEPVEGEHLALMRVDQRHVAPPSPIPWEPCSVQGLDGGGEGDGKAGSREERHGRGEEDVVVGHRHSPWIRLDLVRSVSGRGGGYRGRMPGPPIGCARAWALRTALPVADTDKEDHIGPATPGSSDTSAGLDHGLAHLPDTVWHGRAPCHATVAETVTG